MWLHYNFSDTKLPRHATGQLVSCSFENENTIIVRNRYYIHPYWSNHDMTGLEIPSQEITAIILTLVGPTKLAHILQSLFYWRLLSTSIRFTEICFWEITCSKNFSSFFIFFSHYFSYFTFHHHFFHFFFHFSFFLSLSLFFFSVVPMISQSLVVISRWLIFRS